ncbi:AAA family ATPase [Klebsiella michiganensis]|nr:AAA family ATPase [Klebsiella michiganensis]
MMQLKRILVENLFGLLNYDIGLDQSDTIIITGPNGYGKTMILKIIDNILSCNLEFFFDLQFRKINLEYNKSVLTLIKNENNILSIQTKNLETNTKTNKNFHINRKIKDKHKLIDDLYNDMSSCEKDNKYFFAKIAYEQLIGDDNRLQLRLQKENQTQNKYLEEFIPENNVTFIKAQRLENVENSKATIEEQAIFLANLIKKASEESAQISQRLDSSFPARLFEIIDENTPTSSISDRLIGIQRKREIFMKFGLIKSEDTLIPERYNSTPLGKEYSTVLHLYISDALEKLSPYEELFEKINLFVSLMNEKMLAFKKIKINQENGFHFKSNSGETIKLNNLSSGEQNQIVIYFDLIFKSNPQAIIMIDEPEISLHVAWQKEFLDSIFRIKKLNSFSKIIIATHSPQIVNNNWDITYDLFENNQSK